MLRHNRETKDQQGIVIETEMVEMMIIGGVRKRRGKMKQRR